MLTHTTSPRVVEALSAHLDPRWGSAYWLNCAARCSVRDLEELLLPDGLTRLGATTLDDLRRWPLMDYIPRRYHDNPDRLVIGQTGGTTGRPVWTAYRDDEFWAAFVQPFLDAAAHVGFPRGEHWLFVGPSGPHLISQAARAIARGMGSAEPFTIDFDPRWSRRLPADSFAADRYLAHLVEQATAVTESQNIGVLFATPPMLARLADAMGEAQRHRVRAIHDGGMPLSRGLRATLRDAFPNALLLSGYGNSLLGCCPALATDAEHALDYYPHGDRVRFDLVDETGQEVDAGRVVASRFDLTFLILNLQERDHAQRVALPADAPPAFQQPGLRQPCGVEPETASGVQTLY